MTFDDRHHIHDPRIRKHPLCALQMIQQLRVHRSTPTCMGLISNRFIVYSDEKTLYNNSGRGLVAFHAFLHFSSAVAVKGIATHMSLVHAHLVVFMYKHFLLLWTRERRKTCNSRVYVQPHKEDCEACGISAQSLIL